MFPQQTLKEKRFRVIRAEDVEVGLNRSRKDRLGRETYPALGDAGESLQQRNVW
jgi:hypothetical protein